MRKFKKNLLKIMSSFILGSIAISPTFISTGCGSSNNNPSVIHPTSVTLDEKDLSVEVGAKQKLTATVKPDNATNKSVTWSSADEKIANVDKNGNVTGVKEGTTTVTVKTTDGSLTSTCNVTVSLSHASSVMVQPSDVSLPIGNNYQLNAIVLPDNAVDKTVTWSSNDTNVATVDNNGIITGIGAGETIVTVTTKDGGCTASCGVTVTDGVVHVTGIFLNKESVDLSINDTTQLNATVLPADATDKSVTWTSDNNAIATVDNDGLVTAISEGKTVINATTNDLGFVARCTINVTTIHVNKVTLNNHNLSMQVGNTQKLVATIEPQNATNKSVTWTSDNNAIATVDNDGLVTAVGAGKAHIAVTTNDGNFTDQCDIEVIAPRRINGFVNNQITYHDSFYNRDVSMQLKCDYNEETRMMTYSTVERINVTAMDASNNTIGFEPDFQDSGDSVSRNVVYEILWENQPNDYLHSIRISNTAYGDYRSTPLQYFASGASYNKATIKVSFECDDDFILLIPINSWIKQNVSNSKFTVPENKIADYQGLIGIKPYEALNSYLCFMNYDRHNDIKNLSPVNLSLICPSQIYIDYTLKITKIYSATISRVSITDCDCNIEPITNENQFGKSCTGYYYYNFSINIDVNENVAPVYNDDNGWELAFIIDVYDNLLPGEQVASRCYVYWYPGSTPESTSPINNNL